VQEYASRASGAARRAWTTRGLGFISDPNRRLVRDSCAARRGLGPPRRRGPGPCYSVVTYSATIRNFEAYESDRKLCARGISRIAPPVVTIEKPSVDRLPHSFGKRALDGHRGFLSIPYYLPACLRCGMFLPISLHLTRVHVIRCVICSSSEGRTHRPIAKARWLAAASAVLKGSFT
jgi:hypothetical protein